MSIIHLMPDNEKKIGISRLLKRSSHLPALAGLALLAACNRDPKPPVPTTDLDVVYILPWGFSGRADLGNGENASVTGIGTDNLKIPGVGIYTTLSFSSNKLTVLCENGGQD